MPRPLFPILSALLLVLGFSALAQADAVGFPLVRDTRPVLIWVEPEAGAPVLRAAQDLAGDLSRVTGLPARLPVSAGDPSGPCIIVGRIGSGGLIDRIASTGKINVAPLKGAWEASLRTVVDNPLPGVPQALVIAGSDVRGTIYALYDLSEEIGVSPWHWWADVPAPHNAQPSVSAEPRHNPGPSVQYRGIFINDEDWGLNPWAARTFEPGSGGIGPKTYARVCELLLRLHANTLWPAMHACSPAFNSNPENARVADRYGIVMGSSHAEPMLRNNVREWTDRPEAYNYLTNREGVLRYWEQRLRENGRYENIYTIGMRGIHDSRMQGAKTVAEQREALERIFADQRALIAKHVAPDAARVPQIFCAYKEVLEVYRAGLKVPDDVTLVFPDDNFGYIRSFPSDTERARAGGCGIYYHISYLGRPLSYLWLGTTPPALIWSEMSKAHDLGARKLWIVNAGDIKPAEIGIEFFLRMAWDIKHWNATNLGGFLQDWATRTFGPDEARNIARVMEEYYRLNFERKPEHLQWWLPKDTPVPSPLTPAERAERLSAFARLRAEAAQIGQRLPARMSDAYFELVLYPVAGSAAANERFFCNEEYQRLRESSPDAARPFAARAQAAHRELLQLTADFNDRIAGGKWRGIISLEPADSQWKSMRIAPPAVPEGDFGAPPPPAPPAVSQAQARPIGAAGTVFTETDGVLPIDVRSFASKTPGASASWEAIAGLGRSQAALSVLPASYEPAPPNGMVPPPPRIDYAIHTTRAGIYTLILNILPTHPLRAGMPQRLGYSLDDSAPQILEIQPHDGTAEWSQGVLNNRREIRTQIMVPALGRHVLHLHGIDPGLPIDGIRLLAPAGEGKPGP